MQRYRLLRQRLGRSSHHSHRLYRQGRDAAFGRSPCPFSGNRRNPSRIRNPAAPPGTFAGRLLPGRPLALGTGIQPLRNLHAFSRRFSKRLFKTGSKRSVLLRKDQWPVGSNPFILRAFSRYQHLILGRLAENNRVILGIPGSYHPSEKFMAEMYGFPYFKAAGYPDDFPAAPGYWYRILD